MARPGAAAVVCVVILALDVTAGILGIQAQAAQNKTKNVTVLFIQCEKPVYKAYQLGLTAAVLLVAAHALANFLGGCACICSQIRVHQAIHQQETGGDPYTALMDCAHHRILTAALWGHVQFQVKDVTRVRARPYPGPRRDHVVRPRRDHRRLLCHHHCRSKRTSLGQWPRRSSLGLMPCFWLRNTSRYLSQISNLRTGTIM